MMIPFRDQNFEVLVRKIGKKVFLMDFFFSSSLIEWIYQKIIAEPQFLCNFLDTSEF